MSPFGALRQKKDSPAFSFSLGVEIQNAAQCLRVL
jgi:hypothetical protein